MGRIKYPIQVTKRFGGNVTNVNMNGRLKLIIEQARIVPDALDARNV